MLTGPQASQSSNKVRGPGGKLLLIVQKDGPVGSNATAYTTRIGEIVRGCVPIFYGDWREIPQKFKDDAWNLLTEEYEFDVGDKRARRDLVKSWPQIIRSYKRDLRKAVHNGLKKGLVPENCCPDGIARDQWLLWLANEHDPKKLKQKDHGKKNKALHDHSHSLGRRSLAQKIWEMEQEDAEVTKKLRKRKDRWTLGRTKKDGSILPSAQKYVDALNLAEERRKKEKENQGEEGSDTDDFSDDEITDVFGKDKHGRVRSFGSGVTKKRLSHVSFAEKKFKKDEADNKELVEIKGQLNEVNHAMQTQSKVVEALVEQIKVLQECSQHSTPFANNEDPRADVGANSDQRPSRPLHKNLDKLFATTCIRNTRVPSSCGVTHKPRVTLIDGDGREIASGFVETDPKIQESTHGMKLRIGEVKVCVEVAKIPDAPFWNGPQNGVEEIGEIAGGGYCNWLEIWLKYDQ